MTAERTKLPSRTDDGRTIRYVEVSQMFVMEERQINGEWFTPLEVFQPDEGSAKFVLFVPSSQWAHIGA